MERTYVIRYESGYQRVYIGTLLGAKQTATKNTSKVYPTNCKITDYTGMTVYCTKKINGTWEVTL
jgi:hypothetical protein